MFLSTGFITGLCLYLLSLISPKVRNVLNGMRLFFFQNNYLGGTKQSYCNKTNITHLPQQTRHCTLSVVVDCWVHSPLWPPHLCLFLFQSFPFPKPKPKCDSSSRWLRKIIILPIAFCLTVQQVLIPCLHPVYLNGPTATLFYSSKSSALKRYFSLCFFCIIRWR